MNSSPGCLRVHACQPASLSNGPGLRGVIWLQGCTLACPGCFNPETHAKTSGEDWSIAKAYSWLASLPPQVQGVTISGGEPLQQIPALTVFLSQVRATTSYSVVVFTGFDWDQVQRLPGSHELLEYIDVLIAGRYLQARRRSHGLIGSDNKTMHFLTGRYTAADFALIPEAEVILSADGEISFSGIDPLNWG
jgi:anaerobic ribonucleoside-triphosphate reductase activating protein